jgi:LytS/YehU family sensor histidine kinase
MLWAFATPAILALVRRLPIDRPPRGRNIGIHMATGFAMGVATGGVTIGLAMAIGSPELREAVAPGDFPHTLAVWGLFGLLFYAALASVGLALDYHRRLRERELAASRLESQLVEARLNALRMQLQPHFLFNALNSVSMLVRQGDASTAVRMVARLSDLLRYVLDGDDSMVPLRAEIEFVSRYLEIEQLRFRDRMCVRIAVDDAVQDVAIPGLLLQPLAENAVRHAVAVRAAPTTIELRAGPSDGRLEIVLVDDGPGLADPFDEDGCDGIGLANTRSRLAWTYGTNAEMTIRDATGGGTEVRLSLPLHGNGAGRA